MNLLIIKTLNDGQIVRSLLNYSTDSEATSAMYYELWYATSTDNVTSIMCELICDNGHVEKCEHWERETDERD